MLGWGFASILLLLASFGVGEAAVINYAYKAVTTPVTTSSTSYVDAAGAAIPSNWAAVTSSSGSAFVAGKDYLVLITYVVGNTVNPANNAVVVTHGTTDFTNQSECVYNRHSTTIPVRGVCGFMTKWTAVSGEGIKLRFKTSSATTLTLDRVAMFVMNLSDDLTTSDWKYAEDTNTTGSLGTSPTAGASITFTPAESSQWLVISLARFVAGDTANQFITEQTRGGTPQISTRKTPTSTSVRWTALQMRAYDLTATSQTFAERSSSNAASSQTRTHSAIFALNLNKFATRTAVTFDAGPIAVTNVNYATTLVSASYNPSIGTPTLFGGQTVMDFDSVSREMEYSLRLDGTPHPSDQESNGYQFMYSSSIATDEYVLPIISLEPNVSSGSHTVSIVGSSDANLTLPAGAQDNMVFAMSLELDSGGGPPPPSASEGIIGGGVSGGGIIQ